jgi:histidinol-phosphate aminotransferase
MACSRQFSEERQGEEMAVFKKRDTKVVEVGVTRREMGRFFGAMAAGAAGLPLFSESALAREAELHLMKAMRGAAYTGEVTRINANENPLGPCKDGLEAMARIGPYGGRYSPFDDEVKLWKAVADSEEIDKKCVSLFAGSSDPLFRLACAFTSPERSWVMADPGYGEGAPAFIGSRTIKVPLRNDYAHDVAAMLKAGPDAGVFYVCNPNNPTGTKTPRKDIDFLVANKPQGSIVVVDEAYIHFTRQMESVRDMVVAGKDVVILRTFSKVYGMAGIRSGFAMARPDLLGKIGPWGDGTLPVTGVVCATASLNAKGLVNERRAINTRIREQTFEFLDKRNIKYTPSETNFFMMDVHRPWGDFSKAMAGQGVLVGRLWPIWPTMVRVSVGTDHDMKRFQETLDRVTA